MSPAPPPPHPLRIAILECDTPLPLTAAKYSGYGGVFTTLLRSSAQSLGWAPTDLHITTHHVVDDEVHDDGEKAEEREEELAQRYPRLEDIDAVLVTGSRHNAFDSAPWTLVLLAYLRSILSQSRVRIIGVCYGHQVVGRALGGEVVRNESSNGKSGGWEVSVCEVDLTEAGKEVFGHRSGQLRIHQMHRDLLPSPPPAPSPTNPSLPAPTLLGSSPTCAIQGLYIPRLVLTIQGHPEFNREIVTEILESRHKAGVFGKEVFREAMGRVGGEQDGAVVGKGFLRFLRG